MGLIREPDGVDFVIQSKPLTPEGIAEIQTWIRNQKESEDIAVLRRETVEAFALRLAPLERAQLVHRLVDSLTSLPVIGSQQAN